MWRWVAPFQNAFIGQVGDGLRCGAEDGRGIGPAHGESNRKGDQLRLVGFGGESHAEFEDIGGAHANAVETIGDVDLDKLNRTVGRVRQDNVAEQARQGIAELHGVAGSNGDSLIIEAEEGIIDDGAGPAIMLGDAAHGADTEIWKVLDGVVGEDDPLGLVDHGGELGSEKVDMVIRGIVRAPVDRVGTLRRGPGRRAEDDGRAAMLVLSEEPAGRVPELVKGREVATTLAHCNEGLPAQCI